MPPIPWLDSVLSSVGTGIPVVVSLVTLLLSIYAQYQRARTAKAKQAEASRQVEQLRQTIVTVPLEENLLGQVLSTSTAQAPVGVAEGPASIAQLRQQISAIEDKIRNHRSEIVEVSKIDPVLEATIKVSIDNLTKRIEFLEKTRIEKWDVAIIIFQVLSALGVIIGIVFAIIKYFHP